MSVSIGSRTPSTQLLQTGRARIRRSRRRHQIAWHGPRIAGGGEADRTAEALEGESAADFAARMGLDPSAWRGIAAQFGGASSLSLSAGVSIDFNSSLSASAGIGFSAGIEASAGASLGASFGLDASASVSAGVTASGGGGGSSSAAGFALSAAGGVTAAIETVAAVQASSAAGSARRSFESTSAPQPSSSPRPAMPAQRRAPLQSRGAPGQRLPSASAQAAAPPAPAPPQADRRATTFGFGVPLRPRADVTALALAGTPPTSARQDPSTAPWLQNGRGADGRAADREQARRFHACHCGCGGRSRHGA